MSKQGILMQIIIFFIVVCLAVVCCYKKIKSYTDILRISILVSIVATMAFQVLGFFVIGYLDPFIFIAATIQIIAAFIVSFAIGFVLFKVNTRKVK
jgi:heme A synthase